MDVHEALRSAPVCLVCGEELDEKRLMISPGLCHQHARRVKNPRRDLRKRQGRFGGFRHPERGKARKQSIRIKVFARDRYTCQGCGFPAKHERSGRYLTLDHIVDISRGGKTELSNLWTLCNFCNLGKAKHPELWADRIESRKASSPKGGSGT